LFFPGAIVSMSFMEPGNVVEFIDQQKLITAVITETKKLRLRLLTENNREVNLSVNRLAHISATHIDLSMGRDKLLTGLKETSRGRRTLAEAIDIRELWEILHSEAEWIDLATMTAFCFSEPLGPDHEAAVVRAFFSNRTYFKFDRNRFFPHPEATVEQTLARRREQERINRLVEDAGRWLIGVDGQTPPDTPVGLAPWQQQVVDALRSYYLFEKESDHAELAQKFMQAAGIDDPRAIFDLLVRLGIWSTHENLDILRHEIPTRFSTKQLEAAQELSTVCPQTVVKDPAKSRRRDLTDLPVLTIDGQATLDFDDALSITPASEGFCLGIHIADVGHFVKRDNPLDEEARSRASSIYTPDKKIPMLPPLLAENLCSLKAGEIRPAVSLLATIDTAGRILNCELMPSRIRVERQLSYYDVNLICEEDEHIRHLYEIAKGFRQQRLDQGALQLTLPEVSIWLNNEGEPIVNRINRESPGRILVSELMIMTNYLVAKHLARHQLPAIFRSQPEPRERLFKNGEGTLFQNWMQRKHLSRFILSPAPDFHSGLGLEAYVTATSPIRKYFDLVTQRQIRASFEMEAPYTAEEIDRIIQALQLTMPAVSRIQHNRHRYWLLKHLESRVGKKVEGLVLRRRRKDHLLLIKDYMLECQLPFSCGVNLKPEDIVQLTIQHVDARRDVLSVYVG